MSSIRRMLFRRLLILLALWLMFVVVPAFAPLRAVLVAPLVVSSADPQGDIAYVMAGGGDAVRERLRAASDLYHMHKIKSIYLLDEPQDNGHNFALKRNETQVEFNSRYLQFWGVPPAAIHKIPVQADYLLSSLSEAESMSKHLPADVRRMVVVTSAPHTRRSQLCFQRKLPRDIQLDIYSATSAIHSAELYFPIWQEYIKLLVYYAAA